MPWNSRSRPRFEFHRTGIWSQIGCQLPDIRRRQLMAQSGRSNVGLDTPMPLQSRLLKRKISQLQRAIGAFVSLGAHTFSVRHCPGHRPGHVVFHSESLNRTFVGDVLFAGSIGRTDFPRGNHAQLIASITQRLWPYGNDTIFIPGHGPESSFGQERQSNPFVSGT